MTRPVHIPLSVRKKVAAAIKAARPGYDDQTVDSAQAEAAIDALQPFLVKLIDATENTFPKPTHDSDRLQDGGA